MDQINFKFHSNSDDFPFNCWFLIPFAPVLSVPFLSLVGLWIRCLVCATVKSIDEYNTFQYIVKEGNRFLYCHCRYRKILSKTAKRFIVSETKRINTGEYYCYFFCKNEKWEKKEEKESVANLVHSFVMVGGKDGSGRN